MRNKQVPDLEPVVLDYEPVQDETPDAELTIQTVSYNAIKAITSWDYFERKTVNHVNSYLFDTSSKTLIHSYELNGASYTKILIYNGTVVDSLIEPIDIPNMDFKACRIVNSHVDSREVGRYDTMQIIVTLNLAYL